MNISKLTLDTSKHKYFRSNGWEKVAGIIPESYKQRYLALYEANKVINKKYAITIKAVLVVLDIFFITRYLFSCL